MSTETIREAVVQRCSVKNYAGKFIKKETLAQVFSCEFCEISKNTLSYGTSIKATKENLKIKSEFSTETIREAVVQRCSVKNYARKFIKKEALAQVFSCEFCKNSKNTFFTEHL